MMPQEYEIRIRGTLTASLRSAFAPLETRVEDDGAVTVLSGTITDQADLTGILQALDGLGLVLLEVRPSSAKEF